MQELDKRNQWRMFRSKAYVREPIVVSFAVSAVVGEPKGMMNPRFIFPPEGYAVVKIVKHLGKRFLNARIVVGVKAYEEKERLKRVGPLPWLFPEMGSQSIRRVKRIGHTFILPPKGSVEKSKVINALLTNPIRWLFVAREGTRFLLQNT